MTDEAIGAIDTPAGAARCLNCGALPAGEYCQGCGVRVENNRLLSTRELTVSILRELTDWDSRFLRTVRLLLLHPGRLTAEYVAGRRGAMVPPMRLYLSVSAVYFLSFVLWEPMGEESLQVRQMLESAKAAFTSAGKQEVTARLEAAGPERFAELFVQAYNTMLPGLMFAMAPLCAVILRELYKGTRPYFHEHFVFFAHYTSFTFIAALLMLPLVLVGTGTYIGCYMPVCAVYLFLAMKTHYEPMSPGLAGRFALILGAYMAFAFVGSGVLSGVSLFWAVTQLPAH